VTVASGAARVEGILAYPFERRVNRSALIAGPHPLLGGNVDNNVVRALRRALVHAGYAALSFGYRHPDALGDGARGWSAMTAGFWRDGRCDEEALWLEDARAAAGALRDWTQPAKPLLVGYSFGCCAVAACAATVDPAGVALISPNPRRHDFAPLATCAAPLLVVQSDNDFTCTLGEGAEWFASLREPKTRVVLSAGEHFFRGCEAQLRDALLTFLNEHVEAGHAAC